MEVGIAGRKVFPLAYARRRHGTQKTLSRRSADHPTAETLVAANIYLLGVKVAIKPRQSAPTQMPTQL